MSISDILSAYTSDEFKTPAPRPHCQWNNKSKSNYGLLIDRPNVEAAQFNHTNALKNGWRKIAQEFSGSPQPVDCLITANPVLIVVRRGMTKIYERATGEYLGIYNRKEHSGLNINKVSRFLVFLAVQSNTGYQLLHPQPMQLSMKGVQRGAFLEPGGHLDTLDKAVEQYYPGAPKFAFAIHIQTAPELRGQAGNSSLVTCLAKPQVIATQADLDTFFIGEENMRVVMEAYETSKDWQATEGHGADSGTRGSVESPDSDPEADDL
ncbi:MAG: hypothetical protein H7Y37_07900 [Anaerolineae bacterium]|nr:hypothetical protein [Gloeobacterales cyanobacterium ES-bin-313]